jgi:hypothetical protein
MKGIIYNFSDTIYIYKMFCKCFMQYVYYMMVTNGCAMFAIFSVVITVGVCAD